MGFQDAVRTCLSKYATFSGRAGRPEYWYFVLFLFLANLLLGIVDGLLFGGEVRIEPGSVSAQSNGPLVSLFSLAMLVPSLAAGWRRMHDTGRSGLYLLYPLIVMVGLSLFLGFMAGFGNLAAGNFGALFAALGGLVAVVAVLVLLISPLLVLWWLTRPSQGGTNEYGPPSD
ncbi:MAG: DUF805 domain-containing protein [Jhaorihella sp.]